MREIRIDEIENLDKLIYDHPFKADISRDRDLYVYRGMPDANYSLVTSLQRICKEKRNNVELNMLNNFAKYAELEEASIKDSVWRKMMLGQHHGLPTRLLDWSKSPLIALHFATTEGDMDKMDQRDCAVYRLDIEKLHEKLPENYQKEMTETNQKVFTIDMLDHVCRDLMQYDKEMGSDKMVMVEPPSMDERMMNQYSFFSIVPAGVNRVENILELLDNDAVCKYVISRNLRWRIRDMLDMSNINERMVYPGLDGIATWLARHYFVRNVSRLSIEMGNIVDFDGDAIVNTTDLDLNSDGRVSEKIFNAAGMLELTKACKEKAKEAVLGKVVVTGGYQLKARNIIHAITPSKLNIGDTKSEEYLRSVYKESLKWLMDNKLHSIGFPLIGGGHKRFDREKVWRVGLEECDRFQKENKGYPLDITFIVWSGPDYENGQAVLHELRGESHETIVPSVRKEREEEKA